jgi:Divergent InlB B-repeat domain
MRRVLGLILFLLPLASSAWGQSCTLATCTAASTSESDFLAALPSSSNTHATVVVNIPNGTSGWTSTLSYTIPSAVTNLTIQGGTVVTCTGTEGSSGYSCSATDNSIIQDSYAANGPPILKITTGASNTFFRMTALTIEGGSIGSASNNKYGVVVIGGGSQNFRFDHNHVNNNTYSPATISAWILVNGSNIGVMDHNLVDLGSNTSDANGFLAYNTLGDSVGNGDGTWSNASGFGSANFLFMEANQFNGGYSDDCTFAGRFVSRYNLFNNNTSAVQTHSTKTSAGPERGCRAWEVYHNYIARTPTGDAPIGTKIGTGLVWGNTMASGTYYNFFAAVVDRNAVTTETATPGGWGYCGTTFNSNGLGSCWDGNNGGTANVCGTGLPGATTQGYPCLDGVGRGQTQQTLNGKAFNAVVANGRLNQTTGTIAWPQQYLEPVYLWMNTVPSGNLISIRDNVTLNNRDIYGDCTAGNSGCTGSFTGAVGTGYGLHSARPATCTPGPGTSPYFLSPTGSDGVAYWATDDNAGLGELWVCTATNTWTAFYQPYTYPHPLITGGTTYSLGISTTGPCSSSAISGPNSSSGTYASGTTIGPLTVTPCSGATFTGWTVTGSAACSGTTNPCPSFSIAANTTVVAAFTGTPVCSDPTEVGPNYGSTYNVPPTILPLSIAWNSSTPGCSMFMTFDASPPNCTVGGSTQAYAAQSISVTTLMRVIACQTGYTPSNIKGDTWTILGAMPPTSLTIRGIKLSGVTVN